ncbi:MAG: hypothetical protein EOP82_16970 [Variovorax sp.]|nr:MAG: hypothetical protein EOP82_16970 [Variovorax sp.]
MLLQRCKTCGRFQ